MGRKQTVGVLYPGEMGAALAGVLTSAGARVVTTLQHRSERTRRHCSGLDVAVLGSLSDVIREADIVLSVVSPAAAAEVADAYCNLAHLAPAGALFVDANSIRPELAAAMASQIEASGHEFVDAAINGLARNLTAGATLFLSGGRARDIATLFGDEVTVRVLGDEPGRASAMKMLLSGVSKGTCALFLELALLAHQRDMLAEMLEESGRIYPGIAQLIERMLPTYARHAGRRAEEMRELEATAQLSGIDSHMIDATKRLHAMLADMPFGDPPEGGWTAASLIRHVAERGERMPRAMK